MYLKRNALKKKIPVARKGTKYVARASSHISESVPTVIAVRDMLGLARNLSEVKKMILSKILKINGKVVKDYRESIKLFNVFSADKDYELIILPTGRYSFRESKNSDKRIVKIVGKNLLKSGVVQLNFHDGSNVLSKESVKVGDSVLLDFSGKISSVISLDKSKKVFVVSGKYVGLEANVVSITGSSIEIESASGKKVKISKNQVVAI